MKIMMNLLTQKLQDLYSLGDIQCAEDIEELDMDVLYELSIEYIYTYMDHNDRHEWCVQQFTTVTDIMMNPSISANDRYQAIVELFVQYHIPMLKELTDIAIQFYHDNDDKRGAEVI